MSRQQQTRRPAVSCPDCGPTARGSGAPISRRDFIAGAAGGIVASGWVGAMAPSVVAQDAIFPGLDVSRGAVTGETLVAQLYGSLTDAQRQAICFGFDHELRSVVDANWKITETRVDRLFNGDQQDLVKQIFNSLHSEQYAPIVMSQVEHDAAEDNGFGSCAVAIFGEPGTGKFEFVITGRHLTRRCDGDSVDGAGFGGPIFYGHAAQGFDEAADHPGNVYWYQARRANEVFAALDGKQREVALMDGDPRRERKSATVAIKPADRRRGIRCTELSSDQKGLVAAVLRDVLAPFRAKDVDEAMKIIDEAGGIDSLNMAFYKHGDIGEDRVWDIWEIEGPSMVWFFRGAPHVHTWVNVQRPTA